MLQIKNEDMGKNPAIEVSELIKVFAALTTMFMEVSRGEDSQYFCKMKVDEKGRIKFVNRKAGTAKGGDDYYEYSGR